MNCKSATSEPDCKSDSTEVGAPHLPKYLIISRLQRDNDPSYLQFGRLRSNRFGENRLIGHCRAVFSKQAAPRSHAFFSCREPLPPGTCCGELRGELSSRKPGAESLKRRELPRAESACRSAAGVKGSSERGGVAVVFGEGAGEEMRAGEIGIGAEIQVAATGLPAVVGIQHGFKGGPGGRPGRARRWVREAARDTCRCCRGSRTPDACGARA